MASFYLRESSEVKEDTDAESCCLCAPLGCGDVCVGERPAGCFSLEHISLDLIIGSRRNLILSLLRDKIVILLYAGSPVITAAGPSFSTYITSLGERICGVLSWCSRITGCTG